MKVPRVGILSVVESRCVGMSESMGAQNCIKCECGIGERCGIDACAEGVGEIFGLGGIEQGIDRYSADNDVSRVVVVWGRYVRDVALVIVDLKDFGIGNNAAAIFFNNVGN